MKKIIISGATGCIGMALIDQHLNLGNKVLVIANPNSKKNINLHNFINIKIIYSDLSDYDNIELDEKYDVFYHLAWQGGGLRNNFDANFGSALLSIKAVNLAYRCGCISFVGAGSQAECGIQETPISETTICDPSSFFGAAKLSSYYLCKVACSEKNIIFSWARILSIYGPYDGDNTLITSTVNKLILGLQPSFSSGTQIWDFLYSTDAANALLNIGLRSKTGGIYTIASGEMHELKYFILKITQKFNINGQEYLNQIAHNSDSVKFLVGDISRLKTEFDWKPEIAFEQGLKYTIDHLRLKIK